MLQGWIEMAYFVLSYVLISKIEMSWIKITVCVKFVEVHVKLNWKFAILPCCRGMRTLGRHWLHPLEFLLEWFAVSAWSHLRVQLWLHPRCSQGLQAWCGGFVPDDELTLLLFVADHRCRYCFLSWFCLSGSAWLYISWLKVMFSHVLMLNMVKIILALLFMKVSQGLQGSSRQYVIIIIVKSCLSWEGALNATFPWIVLSLLASSSKRLLKRSSLQKKHSCGFWWTVNNLPMALLSLMPGQLSTEAPCLRLVASPSLEARNICERINMCIMREMFTIHQ